MGHVRKLIREALIDDYIKYLQRHEQWERDIDAKYPGALEQLIHHDRMTSSLGGTSTNNAEKVIKLYEKGYISEDEGDGTLFAVNSMGEEFVWDTRNDAWWSDVDDPKEFDRVANKSAQKQTVEKLCPDCGGTKGWSGLFGWNDCKTCGGTGKVSS